MKMMQKHDCNLSLVHSCSGEIPEDYQKIFDYSTEKS